MYSLAKEIAVTYKYFRGSSVLVVVTVKHFTSSDVINTLRTGEADLRFYITTVQDG